MFLTKKALFKVVAISAIYLTLGIVCTAASVYFTAEGINTTALNVMAVIAFLAFLFSATVGKYAEGKGKLINRGNKLVRCELKPAEFLREYEVICSATDLAVKKPESEVLMLVLTAHDVLDNKESALRTADEMIATSTDKRKTLAKLVKSSLLFSHGRKDEAEATFIEANREPQSAVSRMMADLILKSDRAMAMGDYKTVESYCIGALENSFPRLDNLGKLVTHFTLGEVYEKLGDTENAITHYEYCAEHGGETALCSAARDALINLGRSFES